MGDNNSQTRFTRAISNPMLQGTSFYYFGREAEKFWWEGLDKLKINQVENQISKLWECIKFLISQTYVKYIQGH